MTETLIPSVEPEAKVPSPGVTSAKAHVAIDLLEAWLKKIGPVTPPEPVHRFTPGLYSRELTMAAGLLLTSKVHKTDHQYVVSKGSALVFVDGEGWRPIVAPYHGITRAGTRRVLRVIEECTWTTFHPTPDNETDLVKLEERLIEPHVSLPFAAQDLELIEAEVARWENQRQAALNEEASP